MPVFIAKYNEHKSELHQDFGDVNLLGTIKIPHGNLSLLNQRLPEAQYNSDVKKVDERKDNGEFDYKPDSSRKQQM